MGRRRKGYDPEDPDTWPADAKRRRYKELMIRDILIGSHSDTSPKSKWIDKKLKVDDNSRRVKLDEDMLDTIADIQAMYKIGTFRFLPDSVLKVLQQRSSKLPFDPKTVDDPNPEIRSWNVTSVVRMSLEVMRLYLFATDPYMRKVLGKVVRVDGAKIGLKSLDTMMEETADLDSKFEYEDDDDFDFSILEDIDF